tara:strand:+ start:1132 stop:1353 length:222 start_codon:yes stop_codon:yes gene_type:complete
MSKETKMITVSKFSNNGFKAEIKRWINDKNKVCYAVFSEDKLVYRNVFHKKGTATTAANDFLMKKANPLKVVK